MRYKLQVFSIWEYGSRTDAAGNPHQEDSLYPAYGSQSPQDRTFILCDGMGGHGSGEVASAAVCEAMSRFITNDGHDAEGIFTDKDLDDAIAAAYRELDRRDTHESRKMGTTMTLLKLHTNGATVAHIGDSRVYHIRPGATEHDTRILFQTRDHSLVNDLIKAGELTEEEARYSAQKNVITRSMMPGSDCRHRADVWHTADIKAGDYFYMCSDGMLEQPEMNDGSALKRIFSHQGGDDAQKVQVLKGATDTNKDNHTAFIIHILDVQGTPSVTEVHQSRVSEANSIHENRTADTTSTLHTITKQRKLIIALLAACILLIGACIWAITQFIKSDESAPTTVQPVSDISRDTVPARHRVKPVMPSTNGKDTIPNTRMPDTKAQEPSEDPDEPTEMEEPWAGDIPAPQTHHESTLTRDRKIKELLHEHDRPGNKQQNITP